MLVTETLGVALGALRVNKLRSVLTMLGVVIGVVIGVAAVITMVALGTGAQRAVEDRLARLGTTVIQINPRRAMQGGVGSADAVKLTQRDVERSATSDRPTACDGGRGATRRGDGRQGEGSSTRSTGRPPTFCSGRYTRWVRGSTLTVCACGAARSPSGSSVSPAAQNAERTPDSAPT
jgi:hypothetical protein